MSPAQLEDGFVPQVVGVVVILPLTIVLGGKIPTLHLHAVPLDITPHRVVAKQGGHNRLSKGGAS